MHHGDKTVFTKVIEEHFYFVFIVHFKNFHHL